MTLPKVMPREAACRLGDEGRMRDDRTPMIDPPSHRAREMKTHLKLLQGTARLAGDGVLGMIDTVEDMHLAIVGGVARAVPFGFGARIAHATAFAYARVRDAATLTRRTADGALDLLERLAPRGATYDPSQLAWLAALNGAIGDHLEASGNPLALDMRLCRRGHALDPHSPQPGHDLAAAGGSLIVFVHGLGMNDRQWRDASGTTFGDRLETDGLGHALHLRYNSGRRIDANGRDLSRLLQTLHEAHAVERLVLVGHSMGGLVCRSACAHAQRDRCSWAGALTQVISLGTPHLGAPLERFGHALGSLLAATPYTRALADVARARSAGIKDLRRGWTGEVDGGSGMASDTSTLPFGERVRWRMIAASLSTHATGTRARWLGDGLVPVSSALGQHADETLALRVPATHRRVLTRTGHMDLLTSPAVHAQLHEWIA